MRGSLLAVFVLIYGQALGVIQDWHRVPSSFCSQIKAKGAKVSGRFVSIFEAPDVETKCCDSLNMESKIKTEDFGHFRVLDLPRGRYFLSFDLKSKQVNVPIVVDRIVDKRYVGKDCEPDSKITVDQRTNEVSWQEWVIVD